MPKKPNITPLRPPTPEQARFIKNGPGGDKPGHVKGRAVYRTAKGEELERATIYLPRELFKKAKMRAIESDCRGLSDYIAKVLQEHLK